MSWARKSPMKRSAFKTADRATSLRRSTIKQRHKKPTVAEGSKYLAACRGEECYLRVPGVCCSLGWPHESVVPCHSNQSRHGRGGAMKAEHQYTVPGCARCHEWIDRGAHGRQERFDVWDAAFELWLPVRERKMGLAEVECSA